MEYSLYMIYYMFQGFLNMVMDMDVAEGVPVGGLLIGAMILNLVLRNFEFGDVKKSSRKGDADGN